MPITAQYIVSLDELFNAIENLAIVCIGCLWFISGNLISMRFNYVFCF